MRAAICLAGDGLRAAICLVGDGLRSLIRLNGDGLRAAICLAGTGLRSLTSLRGDGDWIGDTSLGGRAGGDSGLSSRAGLIRMGSISILCCVFLASSRLANLDCSWSVLAVSLLIAASDRSSYCFLSLCCFLSDRISFLTVFLMPSILTPCCCPSMVLKFATFLLVILAAFFVCIFLVLTFIFFLLLYRVESCFVGLVWIPYSDTM